MTTQAAASPANVVVFNEKHLVGYSCSNMFAVVSDVEHYHEFVPYCRRSVVTLRKPSMLSANLVVGFQPFLNLSYTSHVTLVEPHLVTAVCSDQTLFEHLKTVWKLNPTADGAPEACVVDFAVSFAFLNPGHSYVARMFLDSIVREMVAAYIARAAAVWGPPSQKHNRISVSVSRKD